MLTNPTKTKAALPSIKEYDSLSYNPFYINDVKNKFVTYHTKPSFKKGFAKEGEVEKPAEVKEMSQLVTKDRTPFVKFYEGSFDRLIELSNPAMNILRFIVDHIHKDSDFICLPVATVLEYCKYNVTSRILYYAGMRELLAMEILSPKTSAIKNEYWINPNLFYKGDRVAIFEKQKKQW